MYDICIYWSYDWLVLIICDGIWLYDSYDLIWLINEILYIYMISSKIILYTLSMFKIIYKLTNISFWFIFNIIWLISNEFTYTILNIHLKFTTIYIISIYFYPISILLILFIFTIIYTYSYIIINILYPI